MKYWKNGFHLTQDKDNSRVEISDERWKELLRGNYEQGLEIYTREDGYPDLREPIISNKDSWRSELDSLKDWFNNIYDNQVKQYERCQRLGIAYDEKYGSILELDNLAQKNAKRISELKELLK